MEINQITENQLRSWYADKEDRRELYILGFGMTNLAAQIKKKIWIQDDGVKAVHSSPPEKAPKLQLAVEQASIEGCWNHNTVK